MSKIREELKENISESIESHIDAIKSNLEVLFNGLLYSLKLEMGKEGHKFVIDNLITKVIDSTHWKEIGYEAELPCWNEQETKELVTILKNHLEKHGITSRGV